MQNFSLRFIFDLVASIEQDYRYLKVFLVWWKKVRFSGALPAAIIRADRSRIYLWTCMLYTLFAFYLAWFQSSHLVSTYSFLVIARKKWRTFSSPHIILRYFNFNIAVELWLTHDDPGSIYRHIYRSWNLLSMPFPPSIWSIKCNCLVFDMCLYTMDYINIIICKNWNNHFFIMTKSNQFNLTIN